MKAKAQWLFRFARNSLAVIGLLSVIYHAGFDLSVIVSGSMSPALQGESAADGDWLLTERFSYWFRQPRRWEVVQLVSEDLMVVAKRIVGLPGENVAIDAGRAVVNGEPVAIPASLAYLHYYEEGMIGGRRSLPCHNGYVVLGDDSQDSYDSRFTGPIERGAIRGRAWLIVWPPRRMGFVKDGTGD